MTDTEKATFGKLTIYRFEEFESVKKATNPFDGFESVTTGSHNIGDHTIDYHLFFLRQSKPQDASWYKGFKPLLGGVKHSTPVITLPGFILLAEIEDSVYALTGGSGSAAVRSKRIARHFGLDLARKLVSTSELRGLSQKDTSGNVNYIDRAFNHGYNPLGDSGNLKRILTHLRASISKDNERYAEVGRSITAGDALTANGKKSFLELMQFVKTVDEVWKLDTTLLAIPELEQLHKKSDAVLIQKLTLCLIETLADYDEMRHNFFLDSQEIGYLPDRVSDYELVEARKTGTAYCACEDMLAEFCDILNAVSGVESRLKRFQKARVKITFDDGHYEKVELAKHICGDITYKSEVYFINQGVWYKASSAFLNQIDEELDQVEYISPEQLGLTPWGSEYPDEDRFNRGQSGLHLLDKFFVKVGSERGIIEFCDLLGEHESEFRLIHVKRAHGAALRALFAQGAVSAQFFAQSVEFQECVFNARLSGGGALPEATKKLLANLRGVRRFNVRVVFAINDRVPSHSVSNESSAITEMLKGTLTPFAKVDLLTRVDALRAMGYNVSVTRIRPYPIESQNAS